MRITICDCKNIFLIYVKKYIFKITFIIKEEKYIEAYTFYSATNKLSKLRYSDFGIKIKNYNFVRFNKVFVENLYKFSTLVDNALILTNDKFLPICKHWYLYINNEYAKHIRKEVLI